MCSWILSPIFESSLKRLEFEKYVLQLKLMSLDIEKTKFKTPPKEPPQNNKINTKGSLFKIIIIIIIIIINLNLNLKTHTPHQS
jgi:hypothetical protein